MIRINLVRGKRKKRKEMNFDVLYLLIPVCMVVALLMFHRSVVLKIDGLNTAIVQAEAETARLAKEIGEVEKFKIRKAELQKKVDIISNLQVNRKGPVKVYEALSSAIPEKCWIDSCKVEGDKVSVAGIAINPNTVANFMTELGKTGRFKNVVLGSADQSIVQKYKLVKFNLTFDVIPG